MSFDDRYPAYLTAFPEEREHLPAQEQSARVGNRPPFPRQRTGRPVRNASFARGRRRRLTVRILVATPICGLAWLVVTGVPAARSLEHLRSDAVALRAALDRRDVAGAEATLQRMSRSARQAHRLTRGPVWATAARIPWLGSPLRSVRGIADAADGTTTAASRALTSVGALVGPGRLRGADAGLPTAELQRVMPVLSDATKAVSQAAATVAGLPRRTWWGTVDNARALFADRLEDLRAGAGQINTAAQIAPALLGAGGPRSYFVAFQNDAEARGTGGLPGAFGIMDVADGKIRFESFYTDVALSGVTANVDLGRDYDTLWRASGSEQLYVNSNLGPNFPDAARIWQAMWQAKTGRRLDGAVAVDPQVLSYLLATVGPATLPDGSSISADNVVQLTENTAYLRFGPDITGRKRFLVQVAEAVTKRMADSHGDGLGLLTALARAVRDRRLLVWTADPAVESQLLRLPVSGAVPETSGPYAGLTVVNDGGNKLDYYLDRSLTWDARQCHGVRVVTVTIDLRNSVPSDVTSPFVVARSDSHPYAVSSGDNRVLVYFAASVNGRLTAATLDGRPQFVGSGMEHGHPMYSLDVELPRQRTRRIVLHLEEPATPGTPLVPPQPLVRPMAVTVRQAGCAQQSGKPAPSRENPVAPIPGRGSLSRPADGAPNLSPREVASS